MKKKFELTSETITTFYGRKLFRIKALRNFGDVKKGDLGGYVEKEANLSQFGTAWVYENAQVSGNAFVYGSAKISGKAMVREDAQVFEKASVSGFAEVAGNAWVHGRATVTCNVTVSGNARVFGNAKVTENAYVKGSAIVSGNANISGNTMVDGNVRLDRNADVRRFSDYAAVKGFGSCFRDTTFYRGQDGKIRVVCGCFRGDLEAFRKKVKETHGDNKYAKEYLMIADLMEMHFKEGDNGE